MISSWGHSGPTKMGDSPLCLPDPQVWLKLASTLTSLSASPLQVLVPPRERSTVCLYPFCREVNRWISSETPLGPASQQPCHQRGLTPSPPAASRTWLAGDTGRVTFPVYSKHSSTSSFSKMNPGTLTSPGKVICEAGKSTTEGGSCYRSKPALCATTSSLAEGRGGGRPGWGEGRSRAGGEIFGALG